VLSGCDVHSCRHDRDGADWFCGSQLKGLAMTRDKGSGRDEEGERSGSPLQPPCAPPPVGAEKIAQPLDPAARLYGVSATARAGQEDGDATWSDPCEVGLSRASVAEVTGSARDRSRQRDRQIEVLYAEHYQSLLRAALLLLDGSDAAEDVVQEAFIRTYGAAGRLSDPRAAGSFLRTTMVNLTRGRWRRHLVALRHPPKPPAAPAGPEDKAVDSVRHAQVIQALRGLPRRERECLVLRYYLELSEAETAASLGISAGAVKGYTSRGRAALATAMKEWS
jgi:RNA polymerase sigma-70 factor (sigma-E family)